MTIVKVEGRYLIWSTIVDAPTTFGMTLDELKSFWREEYGRQGERDLERSLIRVEECGTSSLRDSDARDTMWLNRAGPGETSLSYDEIVEFYVKRKRDPKSDSLAAYRKEAGLVPCPKETCPQMPDENGYGEECDACWGSGWRKP